MTKPSIARTALLILDGWGLAAPSAANPITPANAPNFFAAYRNHPSTQLITHGPSVGLPLGQMGNSEVGHTTIGAGRVLAQSLARIDADIAAGTFASHPLLAQHIEAVGKATIHIIALFSDGGVHAHYAHILAAHHAAIAAGKRVVLHAILDGRDTAPCVAQAQLCKWLLRAGITPASLIGRFYAMDRDANWARTEAAYRLWVEGQGLEVADIDAAFAGMYAKGTTDEFMPAMRTEAFCPIGAEDTVWLFNFRADRARQMYQALVAPDFAEFTRSVVVKSGRTLTLTPYVEGQTAAILYPKEAVADSLGAVISANGLGQLRVAETEKYAHVTYFFNGGVEAPLPGEQRALIASPKVRAYSEVPEMSISRVTDTLCQSFQDPSLYFWACNFANGDMVGHCGDMAAAVASVRAVDAHLGKVIVAAHAANINLLIIADHGNIECMVDDEGRPHTAHTLNLVPAIYIAAGHSAPRAFKQSSLTAPDFAHAATQKAQAGYEMHDRADKLTQPLGTLADVAPTILDAMGIEQPRAMHGASLFQNA